MLATRALIAACAAATMWATSIAIASDPSLLLSWEFRQSVPNRRRSSTIWYNHRPILGYGLRVAFSGVPKFDRYPSTGDVSWRKFVIPAERSQTSATRAATR